MVSRKANNCPLFVFQLSFARNAVRASEPQGELFQKAFLNLPFNHFFFLENVVSLKGRTKRASPQGEPMNKRPVVSFQSECQKLRHPQIASLQWSTTEQSLRFINTMAIPSLTGDHCLLLAFFMVCVIHKMNATGAEVLMRPRL